MTKPVTDLARGDVIETDAGPVEVIGEPFLGRSGASMFDDFRLFRRALVRSLGTDRVLVITWDLEASVQLWAGSSASPSPKRPAEALSSSSPSGSAQRAAPARWAARLQP